MPLHGLVHDSTPSSLVLQALVITCLEQQLTSFDPGRSMEWHVRHDEVISSFPMSRDLRTVTAWRASLSVLHDRLVQTPGPSIGCKSVS